MTEKTNTPHVKKDTPPKKVKKKPVSDKDGGVGMGTVIICSAVASLLGITGGAWLSKTIADSVPQIQAEVSLSDLESLKSTLKTLQSRTTQLENKQSEILDHQSKDVAAVPDDTKNSQSSPDLSSENMAELGEGLLPLFEDIENRLNALESQARPVDTMEQTETAESAEEDQSTSIQSIEYGELSETVSNLETQIAAQSKNQISKADLNALKKRVKVLEDEFDRPPVLIPPFPREAVMDVLTGKKDESGSWMSGLLGDKVRVVDAETVNRLDRIEKSVEAGNIEAIKKEVSYLPSETKPVVDGWLAQFAEGG